MTINCSSTYPYRGALRLVIFDWAGTTIDHGCCAPAAAFINSFRQQGVEITTAQARGPMGMEKRAHIAAIGSLEPVAKAWRQIHGRAMNGADVDTIYDNFVPLLFEALIKHSSLIPGVVETEQWLAEQGLKVGATTGYFTEAETLVSTAAAQQGYVPACSISASDVSAGRPWPWMIFRVMEKLQICPPAAVVNVGDTVVDVQSARNGGVWAVGVTRTGNMCGLPRAEFDRLPAWEARSRATAAAEALQAAGAHYVADSVADLPVIITAINERLARGENP